jgi:hypothetical protein
MSQATILSSSPMVRLRLASTASVAARADACASPSGTWLGTLPNGPSGELSAASAPCPETNARLSRTRTHWNRIVTPGGSLGSAGNSSPSSSSRCSTRPVASFRRDLAPLHLHDDSALAPGWDVATAARCLWAVISQRVWDDLVMDQGWSTSQYRNHITALLEAALLRQD